jgi:hypothetical protein
MLQNHEILLAGQPTSLSEPAKPARDEERRTKSNSGATLPVAGVLAMWFLLVFVLGAAGAFVRSPGSLPLPILLGVTAPIIISLVIFAIWPAFRDFVASLDLALMTGIQAWRFAGLGFLPLYAHGVLPGLFAWPAGLGDIAIGITAPWIALALTRRPSFASSRSFIVWTLLGILDLVTAVSTGALSSALTTGALNEITSAPMAQLPLVLIPAYFVPLFVMLHLVALYQSRRLALMASFGGAI